MANDEHTLVTRAQLRSEFGVPYSRVHIWRLARDGKFPKPLYLSERCPCWRRSDVILWINARAAESAVAA
jgi:predicted DNA-binding transcriptional regulator AlpA